MNRPMIFYIIGVILKIEAVLLVLPMLVSLIYKEDFAPFAFTIISLLVVGFICTFRKPKNTAIYAREGFVIVGITWVVMSIFGAMPFYISGEIPEFIDAFFETVSGFTTTGASILTDIEAMPKGLLFWRSLTHWVGGMGVLVFVLAIIPLGGTRSMHLMRAEAPGPKVGKITPKMGDTAKILYALYFALTMMEILLLCLGGMPFYDSVVHSFGTAGTGGFGIKAESIGAYDNAYFDGVITVFMILFSINFSLYYLLLLGKIRQVLASEELRWFLIIVFSSIGLITWNILPMYKQVGTAFRLAAFQVASVISTTGYSTCDFNLWPEFSKSILVVIMFIGACAGSTGGGIKVSRLIILCKAVKNEMSKMLHPQHINTVRIESKPLDLDTYKNACVFGVAYTMIMVVSFLLVSIDEFDFETSMTGVIATLNNIGPGLGMVGPAGGFSEFSVFSKLVFSIDMLLGRLEIFPILMILAPSTWINKSNIMRFFVRKKEDEEEE